MKLALFVLTEILPKQVLKQTLHYIAKQKSSNYLSQLRFIAPKWLNSLFHKNIPTPKKCVLLQ